MNTELKKNAEGYTDPTAAATLTQAEPGDVWGYGPQDMCLVIKNHGPFSSILLLVDSCGGPDDVKIMTAKGPKYTDPRRLTYGLHRKMGRYLETVSVECFDHVVTAVENALDIYLPRKKADTQDMDKLLGDLDCMSEQLDDTVRNLRVERQKATKAQNQLELLRDMYNELLAKVMGGGDGE
ncbi:MAG: hypothetical protein J6Q14_02865 [Oscillospiraceae bacterium]|nr:hypothetical protein [Oscillospiraceae bacterium]